MASTLKTPGVFVEEISTLPASVAQVATAIPAFVGYTETQPDPDDEGNIPPTRITSMVEYEAIFGGPDKRVLVELSTSTSLSENDTIDDVTTYGIEHILYYSVKMHFNNGGGACYIVSAGTYPDVNSTQISKPTLLAALALLEQEDEPTLLVVPEAIYLSAIGSWSEVVVAMMAQCAKLQDRFSVIDTYPNAVHADEISNSRTSLGTQNLKYGAVYYPRLNTTLAYEFNSTDNDLIQVKLDDGTKKTLQAAIDAGDLNVTAQEIKDFIAEQGFESTLMELPPSGAMTGVYSSVDASRGVWKAPANVSLNSVVAPSILLTNAEQEDLNVTGTGKSINAIRSFTGKGIIVWGARTLDGNSNEWRYVPVRRLFNTVEESLKKATQAVVFEPNDGNTWLRVRNMTENYLNTLWRQGAFAGAKPEDAYFVNVGLGETMTELDILEGRLIIEIGLAAVRPAEFIVLRFTHKLQES